MREHYLKKQDWNYLNAEQYEWKKTTPRYILMVFEDAKYKEKSLKNPEEKSKTYKQLKISETSDFSLIILDTTR